MVAVGFVNEALIIIKHEAQFHVCGDVHVGENTNPTNKLVVEGKAYAREFHVNEANNWPDYVFSKTYKLTPLLEVEKYISQHGHLSEIPS